MVKAVSIAARPRKAVSAAIQVHLPDGVPSTEDQRRFVEAIQSEETVDVNVPRAFTLTLDNHLPVAIAAGVQPMPRSWVKHWYVKQQGVTPYEE